MKRNEGDVLAQTQKNTAKKPKIMLTKAQQKEVQERMSKLKRRNMNNKSSTQSVIPYIEMLKDGVCWISENKFSRTIEFFDTNYELANFEDKNGIFSYWCTLLNYFDNSIDFQFTYENQRQNLDEELEKIQITEQNDRFNDVRKEYSNMLCSQKRNGNNGFKLRKFLTFTVQEMSIKAAKRKLNAVAEEIINLFAEFDVKAVVLDGRQRLEVLYRSLNPFSNDKFIFDWNLQKYGGYSTKDFIAPTSMQFKGNKFRINEGVGSITSVDILAGELSDRILTEYLKIGSQVSVNIHIKSFDHLKAMKLVRGKLSDVEKMKIDEQKKASISGYDTDILPPQIKLYIEELNALIADLDSKNERLFNITLTIRSYVKNENALKLHLEQLQRITQKNSSRLFKLDYQQEQAFSSFLPLGFNNVQVERSLPTSAVAVFIPFTTKELYQPKGCYYGINQITKEMIMADRAGLKNPNGIALGTPGSGKSFSVKREIIDRYLRTMFDIIITDPEGEYYPLVNYLDGQVVKIASNSQQYINPMDINISGGGSLDDKIADKSDFIISLCELIIGGRFGLEGDEKTAIDKATDTVYRTFFSRNPIKSRMPTLNDLLTALRMQGETAVRVANTLEMYVSGSQNLFNHRTNVNISNRLVCYDIKELGTQLKKIAMLILQDQVWNRVSLNRDLNNKTFYYIDEFHLLLRDEQTAKYSVEMWKRFRKWGGVPTGITQNVKDLLSSPEIENIFDNSDFIYMLNQAAGDRDILQEKLHISDEQIKFVTNAGQGKGLIKYGGTILPFEDKFPTDTLMYSLITTKPEERKLLEKKLAEFHS